MVSGIVDLTALLPHHRRGAAKLRRTHLGRLWKATVSEEMEDGSIRGTVAASR